MTSTTGTHNVIVRVSKCCLGIPDDPTDRDIQRILDFLQLTPHIRWITRNLAEIERLRGTPGEPVPVKEPLYTTCLRWLDSCAEVNMSTTSNSALTYVFNRCEN